MIRLRLLGGVELLDSDGEELLTVLAQPKRLALLAYLASAEPPRFHGREVLFELFWPELNTERARAALSQSLYFLRGALGEGVLLSRGRESVGLDQDLIECDAAAFERAVADGDAAGALALYRGDLLAGLHLVDSSAWEQWLEAERRRLRLVAADAAWQCACAAELRGEVAEALTWAGRSLEWSDEDEPRFRAYLEMLDRHGDRSGAIRTFEDYAGRLQRELGVEVAAETRELIECIAASPEQALAAPEKPSSAASAEAPAAAREMAGPVRGRIRFFLPGAAAALALALALLLSWPAWKNRTAEPAAPDPTSSERGARSGAQESYQRGRHLLSRGNVESLADARRHFELALETDPGFAPAWSGLADAYLRLAAAHALPRQAASARARAAAERALELDPDLAEAHASLATVLTRYYWDSVAAERHFRTALELAPDDAETLSRYSAHLRNHGRFSEARAAAERAVAIDPLSFSSHFDVVILDLMEGRYEQAEHALRDMISVDPEDSMSHFMLARVLTQTGDYAAALDILDRFAGPHEPVPFLTLRGYVLARVGQERAAREVLDALAERGRGDVAFDEAVVQLGLGDVTASLSSLERALEQRDHRVRLLREEPMFAPLRGDPRFASLVERAGLGQ